MMDWYAHDGQMPWFGWTMMAGLIIVVVVAVAAGTYVLARNRRSADQRPEPDARHILDMRFARGEIDVDEYRLRLSALSEGPRT